LQLIDNPLFSFPLQFVDGAGSNLMQSISFPVGYVGTTILYQYAMTDSVPAGFVLSNGLAITAGSTL
jgi:hypothetical protein